jgi:CheY-like chemotaxis protein
MTAHALPGEKEKCIQHGMNDYLSKPFNESELLIKIAQWTSNRKEISRSLLKKDEKVTDLSFLLAQSKNNPTLVPEMIGIFTEQTPLHIEALQQAVNTRDYAAIYKTTHTLRNAVGFFGLTQVIGKELLDMEKMARTGNDMSSIESHLKKIIPVLEKAVDELKAVNI